MLSETQIQAIVIGNDHTNTLGVVQALGREGVSVAAVLWGSPTGIVRSSKYAKQVIYCTSSQECIEKIIEHYSQGDKKIIIPCPDEAALVLEENRLRLKNNFSFQHANNYSLSLLQDKSLQTKIAAQCGLTVIRSQVIMNVSDISEDFPYPCIVKPVLSIEGTTADIIVCSNRAELERVAAGILPRTKRLLLQEYISKVSDCGVIGCRFTDGSIEMPCIIDRPRIYPAKTGLGTLYALKNLSSPELVEGIRRYLKAVDYYGLCSFEFVISRNDNKLYFIEANFRNDGENPCLVKAGYNVVYAHYSDLVGNTVITSAHKLKEITTISEIRHLRSMLHGDISILRWMRDLVKADEYMSFYLDDIKPVFRIVFINFLLKGIWSKITSVLKRRIK